MSSPHSSRPRIAILGAGPIGLETALAARAHGCPVTVYEAAPRPAGNVRGWGHVRLFTPWAMNVSDRMREGLAEAGAPLETDPEAHHTGLEYAEAVLDPLWTLPELAAGLRLGTRVVAVGREGVLKHEEIGSAERGRRPFRILVEGPDGVERVEHADVVLDATGKSGNPNTLGDGGIPAPGERALETRIHRTLPDMSREAREWKGKTILLAGGGHSAQTAARELAELARGSDATRVIWVLRKEEPGLGAVQDDPLPLRRELTRDALALVRGGSPGVEPLTGRVVEGVEAENGHVRVRLRPASARGDEEAVRVDRILSLTGGVGDHTLYRQLQVHECYATSGPMKLAAALLGQSSEDCLAQESHGADTLVNPEPGFFILGDKSYGRNNTFLLRTGFQQVTEVFGHLLP
jgi:thioredoxin reductase